MMLIYVEKAIIAEGATGRLAPPPPFTLRQ